MISLQNFVFNELEVNGFVLYDETGECIIVDPGCHSEIQVKQLSGFIEKNALKPKCAVNTHGHFDHVYGNEWVKAQYGCPIYIHKNDLLLIEDADKHAGIFGFYLKPPPAPDGFLAHGDLLSFGSSELEVIHVPGHSPGSICLYSRDAGFLICGDVLFNGSIGRTDLLGGNYDLLMSGIQEKLLTLPGETIVWPGHGPNTTIGKEHDTNPFLR